VIPLFRPDEQLSALGFDADADPTAHEVNEVWRALRSTAHPDKGGDAFKFAELKAAFDLSMAWATRVRPCKRCHGFGRVELGQRGFHALLGPCGECGGSGRR
jgi:DnaJ-class molecular chaperone